MLEEGRLSISELEQAESISALLFKLERAQDLNGIRQAMVPILERLQSDRYTHLRRHMLAWIMRVLFPRLRVETPVSEVHDLKELHAMLAENIDAWVTKTKNEGYLEGMVQGQIEGKAEGIIDILQTRFEEMPPSLQEEILSISSMETLNRLFKFSLTCDSISNFEKDLNKFLS